MTWISIDLANDLARSHVSSEELLSYRMTRETPCRRWSESHSATTAPPVGYRLRWLQGIALGESARARWGSRGLSAYSWITLRPRSNALANARLCGSSTSGCVLPTSKRSTRPGKIFFNRDE